MCLFIVVTACLLMLVECKGGLQIGVKERPETCDLRTKKGDRLSMHYTVKSCCQVHMHHVYFSTCTGNPERWNRI